MKPCASINAFYDDTFSVSVETQIQRMADGGFSMLDMNFWDWSHSCESPFVKESWREWIDLIARCAKRSGVVFRQAHAPVYNFLKKSDPLQDELFRRALYGAQALQIPWVVYHPECRDFREEFNLGEAIEDNLAYYRPLVALAEELNVGVAIENMNYKNRAWESAEMLKEMVDALDSPCAGICWDTGHAHIRGIDQPAAIFAMGGRLRALHVQDNDGISDQHMPPHFGTINWPPLIGALDETGYSGEFTFEAHNIVRRVPEACKADAVRLMYRIGVDLTGER